jgi:hypothetical protein
VANNIPSPYTAGGGGGGSGTVTSVTAADTSVVVTGTPTVAPTLATGTVDVIAADHPAAANWSNNSHKITSLANGSAAQDAAAFGQIPTSAGSIGGLLAANNLTDVAARQTSLNNLAGAVTSGDFLRGNGSNVLLAAIGAGDLPGTLNATAFSGNVTMQDAVITTDIALKTTSYVVTTSDFVLLTTTAGGDVTYTLPDATTCAGQQYYFVLTDANNNVDFATASSQTIGGFAAADWSLSQLGSALAIISDGANWQPLGSIGSYQNITIAPTGTLFCYGLAALDATDTSGGASVSSPSFVSGTALQVNASRDTMLYIAIQTAAALAVAIGSTSAVTTALMPSKTYALGLLSIRVPRGWFVKITGTVADLAITAIAC